MRGRFTETETVETKTEIAGTGTGGTVGTAAGREVRGLGNVLSPPRHPQMVEVVVNVPAGLSNKDSVTLLLKGGGGKF